MDTVSEVDDQVDPTEQSQADTIFNLVIVSLLVSFVLCVLPHLGVLTGSGNPNIGRKRGMEGVKGLTADVMATPSAADASFVISVRVYAANLGERDATWKNLPRQTTYWTVEEMDRSAREYHVFFVQPPRGRPKLLLKHFRATDACDCDVAVFVGGKSIVRKVTLPSGRDGNEDLEVFTINFSANNEEWIEPSKDIVLREQPTPPSTKP